MVALSAARPRKERSPLRTRNVPVKATSQIHQGGLVALLAGQAIAARPGVDATQAATIKVIGIANDSVLGGASDGEKRLDVDRGFFCFAIGTAGDALTLSDVENDVYVIDDQTVGKTHDTNKRPKAGVLKDITSDGAWVLVG